MIDHTGVEVTNFAKSKAFYDAAFGAMGGALLHTVPEQFTGGRTVVGYGRERPVFWLHTGDDPGKGRHVALTAQSRAQVDAFYAAAMAAGGKDNGGPGLRPHYHEHYYGAFVIDPDGNNIEAVCHKPE